MSEQPQRRKNQRFGKGKKRRNKDFNRTEVNGNRADVQPTEGPGVCVKCGHPAPDGKLCNFHRSLLNSIRNDYGRKTGKSYAPAGPNY